MFFTECSRYLASRFVGKLEGNGFGEIRPKEWVEGSESVSGSDKLMSDETFIESFTEFVSF